jgi:hypothetical protein
MGLQLNEQENVPLNDPPWINPDGSTNVDGWLDAYARDDNTFWRTESGHIMNVIDELIGRLEDVRDNQVG